MQHPFSFSTEYYQFYIADTDSLVQTDRDDFWNSAAETLKVAVGEGVLGISINNYGLVNGTLEVVEVAPPLQLKADFVVEASLRLPSGRLELLNCTSLDIKLEIDVPKGNYRVRISSFNVAAGENNLGEDTYILELWKKRFGKPRIIHGATK